MIDKLICANGLMVGEGLEHIGRSKMNGAKVGSGRYPLGSGKNPYHHGTLSPFGKLRAKRAEERVAKVRSKSLEKARIAKAEKAEYERKKKEAIASGSPKAIIPYINDMTYQELTDLKNRLILEAEFRNLAVKEASEGNHKVNVALAKAKRITNNVNTAVDTYNAFVRVYNAFSSDDLPTIPNINNQKQGKQQNNNQKQDKQQKNSKK